MNAMNQLGKKWFHYSILIAGAILLTESFTVAQDKSPQKNSPSRFTKDKDVPPEVIMSTRALREKFLEDPWRPGYHFVIPEDIAVSGDPNGCFYANGRYHLMYLYKRTGSGFCWGHQSSHDLVHWRNHLDALEPGNGDAGCYSGGAFVNDDGTAWLSYWMWTPKEPFGIGLAKCSGPNYDYWTKLENNPVVNASQSGVMVTKDAAGKRLIYGTADPSNIWKKDGKYYMLSGCDRVLKAFGLKSDSPAEFRGDRSYLFESSDLITWNYKKVFYQRNPEWTADNEDNMCPSFFPLPRSQNGGPESDKHLLLFISHTHGCQYYIGTYDKENDQFLPEKHGRMTWKDRSFFAPEALVDAKGRQIMWAWLVDDIPNEQKRGWSGVLSFPRSLWLGDDGTLRMAPVEELKTLRINPKTFESVKLETNKSFPLKNVVGDSCELEITFDSMTADKCGVKVRKSPNSEEETLIYYDAVNKTLCMDSSRSGELGRRFKEIRNKYLEVAPFDAGTGPLTLRVLVDKSVIEVYANDRQAICRRVYPMRKDSLGIELFVEGAGSASAQTKAWEIMPSNPY